jgi:hypothetical protein
MDATYVTMKRSQLIAFEFRNNYVIRAPHLRNSLALSVVSHKTTKETSMSVQRPIFATSTSIDSSLCR